LEATITTTTTMSGTPPPGLRHRSKANGKKGQADTLAPTDDAVLAQAQAAFAPPKKSYWDYRIALFLITIGAFISRFWNISHPNSVVFDEVHFGKVR
jgi:dolichyl-phosphate-mannose-protein mannosyltransferase